VRGNSFSLRYVALTLETKNQLLALIEGVLVSFKTRWPAGREKAVDNEHNKVSKQQENK
jgi:hypothetical protein